MASDVVYSGGQLRTEDGIVVGPYLPIPLEPEELAADADAQDVIDVLVALGLVTQAEA
jgi:hypothetical protein